MKRALDHERHEKTTTKSKWGAALIVLLGLAALVCSLLWRPLPIPTEVDTGREHNAALADARLWTACRKVLSLATPLLVLALGVWVSTVETCRGHGIPGERGRESKCPSAWLTLGALWGFHALNNVLWLWIDKLPPYWDMANHLWLSLRYLRVTSWQGFLHTLLKEAGPYAPFFHLSTLPFYWLFGASEDTASLANLAALALLIAATYGIGQQLHDRTTGLLGAFLASMYPMIFGLSRKCLIDVTLTAMVVASVYALVRSQYFQHRRYALLFGMTCALGLLTKRSFALFLAGPLLWAFGQLLSRKPSLRTVLNLALPGAIVAAIAAPWYGLKADLLARYLRSHIIMGSNSESMNVAAIGRTLAFYGHSLTNHELQLFFTLLFVVALIFTLWKRRRENGVLALWIGASYGLLSLVNTTDDRFPMPCFPAMALISADWLLCIQKRFWRMALIALTAGVALFHFAVVTYGVASFPSPLPLSRSLAWNSPLGELALYSEWIHMAYPPRPWNWPTTYILHDIGRDLVKRDASSPAQLGIVPNRSSFEAGSFRYYTLLSKLPLAVINVGNDPNYVAAITACTYVVTKEGDQGPPELNRYALPATAALQDPAHPLGQRFRAIGEYVLPGKAKVHLYKQMDRGQTE